MSESASGLDFEHRWRNVLSAGKGLFNLVDASHPLEIYFGANGVAEPTLSIVLGSRPPTVARFDSLTIEPRQREDGSWILLLQLQSMNSFGEFSTMCRDLVKASRDFDTEPKAFAAFLVALDRWRGLFKPADERVMSEKRLRGLAAELICMSELLRPARTWKDIIQGWVGPARAPQDFKLSGNRLVEVKSLHTDSTSVNIASLDQLDRGKSELFLVTVIVERDVEEAQSSFTLQALIQSIESELVGDLELVDEFRSKLREVGYALDDPSYAFMFFTSGSLSVYEIRPEFPRIRREDIQTDILFASYELSLLGLTEFQVSTAQMFGRPSWN